MMKKDLKDKNIFISELLGNLSIDIAAFSLIYLERTGNPWVKNANKERLLSVLSDAHRQYLDRALEALEYRHYSLQEARAAAKKLAREYNSDNTVALTCKANKWEK